MTDAPEILPIEIPGLKKALYLPLSLDKLNQEQYIAFFDLLYRLEAAEINYDDFTVLLVYELLKLKKGPRQLPEDQIEDALSNISILASYISNYFNIVNNKISLKLEYTRNHIEYIEPTFFKKYYGPAQYYHGVDFGEYEDGLNIFLQYNETPSRELLQQLMATFYRRKYSGGRFAYVFGEIPVAMQTFSHVPIGALYGFYYSFAAFHTYFSGSQVYYNGKLIDLSILFSTQPEEETVSYESPYPSLGIKSTGIEIAKTGVLGNLQQVRGTKLWEVALLLYDMRKKDLDERARQEQLKKTTK